MFKKIEIWILYLLLVGVFISYIIFGAMVRREALGGGRYFPVISEFSKIVYFVAEIPSNLKMYLSPEIQNPYLATEQRFEDFSGFIGSNNEEPLFLLLGRHDSNLKKNIVDLIDLKNFKTMHQWKPDYNSLFNFEVDDSSIWKNLTRDATGKRGAATSPIIFEDGSIVFHGDSPLVKIGPDSKLIWLKDDILYHHSIEEDIEGNIWIPVRFHPPKINKKYHGNLSYMDGGYMDDGIKKISKDGKILFEKSITQIFIDNDLESFIFASSDRNLFRKDPIHLNDIQPVNYDTKYWKRGDVFISLRHQSMVFLYRPSTNKIIWKSQGKTFYQHDVDILDSHRISIFNNNTKSFFTGEKVDSYNEILVYDFETQNYTTHLSESLQKEEVRTITAGLAEVLPSGQLYVEETNYGRILFFDADGSTRWTFYNRADDGMLYALSWSRLIYKSKDVERVFKFLNLKGKINDE